MASPLQSRSFGALPTGEPVEAWTLTGAGGLVLEAITYGGIVTRLLAPDRRGRLADVVLGYAELDSYLADRCYFGAIVGRVAGRIANARFELDGEVYRLEANDAPNHLHGGTGGFSGRLWAATPVERADGAPSLRLARRSADGEEGYPGNVDVSVTYTVTADNRFLIETEAATDRPTPFALTHHSYFNLAGENAGTIAGHELQIEANEYVPTDERMTLLGKLAPVASGLNDFREPRRLGDAVPSLFQHHGDLYRLREVSDRGQGTTPARAARLVHEESGRVLEVATTAPYMQLYTGAALDGSIAGKSGAAYPRHAGVCLECQEYADGANTPALGDITLRPGQPRRQVTTYGFSSLAASEGSSLEDRKHTELRYAPAIPDRKDFRIGILGSGFIVDECHLVSYRRAPHRPAPIEPARCTLRYRRIHHRRRSKKCRASRMGLASMWSPGLSWEIASTEPLCTLPIKFAKTAAMTKRFGSERFHHVLCRCLRTARTRAQYSPCFCLRRWLAKTAAVERFHFRRTHSNHSSPSIWKTNICA